MKNLYTLTCLRLAYRQACKRLRDCATRENLIAAQEARAELLEAVADARHRLPKRHIHVQATRYAL